MWRRRGSNSSRSARMPVVILRKRITPSFVIPSYPYSACDGKETKKALPLHRVGSSQLLPFCRFQHRWALSGLTLALAGAGSCGENLKYPGLVFRRDSKAIVRHCID